MNSEHTFTLESAKQADEKGDLFNWVLEYLRNEGDNIKLANYLIAGKPKILILNEFPLKKLIRIMGPEDGMQFVEVTEKWEQRVNHLVNRIKGGAEFPPLIVTDLWKDLQLSDGSHRHEALLRSGIDKYWTIFLFTKEKSKNLLK